MGPQYEEQIAHVDEAGAAFLSSWVHMLAMEESNLAAKRAELWQLPGEAFLPLIGSTVGAPAALISHALSRKHACMHLLGLEARNSLWQLSRKATLTCAGAASTVSAVQGK